MAVESVTAAAKKRPGCCDSFASAGGAASVFFADASSAQFSAWGGEFSLNTGPWAEGLLSQQSPAA